MSLPSFLVLDNDTSRNGYKFIDFCNFGPVVGRLSCKDIYIYIYIYWKDNKRSIEFNGFQELLIMFIFKISI